MSVRQWGVYSYPLRIVVENMLKPTPWLRADARPQPETWRDDRITCAWLGHATVLMNMLGRFVLTDPILVKRLGPVRLFGHNIGMRRISELPLKPEELPPLDVVLLSHAHHDHRDAISLRRARARFAIVPEGSADLIPKGAFERVVALRWGESVELENLRVTALPAVHWGRRYGDHTDRGYCSYLLERNGRRVYFIGDSAYTEEWAAKIAAATAGTELCILPIGDYVFHHNHATPEEMWSLFRRIGGRWLLPTHWRTFILSPRALLPVMEPMERLRRVAGAEADRIVCQGIGETFGVPG